MSSSFATQKLNGKVAIITGGASGIGEATARKFAKHGALAVMIADVQEEKGRQVAESIGSDRCTFVKCDVTDEEQVESLVKSTVERHGQLDIMFSNAGMASKCPQDTLSFDLDAYEKLFSVNVRGVAACVKHAGRAMVDRGVRGSIICTASVLACCGSEFSIDYTMSKHAVLGLVRCASVGLGKHGIRVNCVAPGPIATPLTCGVTGLSPEELEQKFEPDFAMKKSGYLKPEHVADAVFFLASDDSKFVTGHPLAVDGGFVARNI
ncbi:OLC1v1012743C1 [Oldenlandia corymbosa var. corymbosa]|uniref:OLC1v1012743C1 n=1 Tax=Oldenlandia corymbosa var. corymbosa TaxID=529605 RepID=A0AAV1DYN4_OLDCO|nr:OLC1v1012743C1 [Oldenlandia corymbosa var. corymbosa]